MCMSVIVLCTRMRSPHPPHLFAFLNSGTFGADPSCCFDLHEKQWTLSVHQAGGNGTNLTDLRVNGMGMYSGGNCVSEVPAVDTQGRNDDNGGRYMANERLLGVKAYERTFRVVTVVED